MHFGQDIRKINSVTYYKDRVEIHGPFILQRISLGLSILILNEKGQV